MAALYHKLTNYKGAAETLQRVIRFMPSNIVGRTNLGFVYIAQQKFREAVKVLSEAIRIDPSAAEAYQFPGCAYFHVGEKKRDLEAFSNRCSYLNILAHR